MREQPGHNTLPHARLPPSFLGMDDLTTERSFDSQATMGLAYFFDMLSMGFCTDEHWQTADVTPIVAGVKCLYCRVRSIRHVWSYRDKKVTQNRDEIPFSS